MTPIHIDLPKKMPRKTKKVIRKWFDDRHITEREWQRWSRCMRYTTRRVNGQSDHG